MRVAATEPVTLPLTDGDGVPDALALGLPLVLGEPVRLEDGDTDVLAVCAGGKRAAAVGAVENGGSGVRTAGSCGAGQCEQSS